MDHQEMKAFVLAALPEVVEELLEQAKSHKTGSVHAARLLFEVAGIIEPVRRGPKVAKKPGLPLDEADHPPPAEVDIDNELVEFEEIAKRIR